MYYAYGFLDVENTDWFVESSHKNGIPIMRNVTEYATFWMNKSKVDSTLESKHDMD